MRPLREDQARDRLTTAQAVGHQEPESVRQVRLGRRLDQVPAPAAGLAPTETRPPRQAQREEAPVPAAPRQGTEET